MTRRPSTKNHARAFLVAAALSFCLPACKLPSKDKDGATHGKSDSSASSTKGAASSAKSATKPTTPKSPTDTGKFTYAFREPVDPADKTVEPLFKLKKLEGVVSAMGVFALPRDVPVLVTDEGVCKGTQNAFYQPDKHAIFVCYPLANTFYKSFLGAGMKDADAAQSTLDAMVFTVMHEMGHGLIAELNLGVTGKEEDAVDELATLILIQNKKPEWAVEGTQALILLTKGQGAHPPYFDEHSMSEQRFYDILCMIYGSDPPRFPGILEKFPELKPRAPKCPNDYSRRDKAWTGMLVPHQRQ